MVEKRTTRKPPLRARAIAATFDLMAVEGWSGLTLSDIAKAAEASLPELFEAFPSKVAIVNAYMDDVDKAVLKGAAAADESKRDRLFDIVMRRFDTLADRKNALRALSRDIACDPLAAACLGLRLRRSLVWMLEAAGVSASGIMGALRVKAFGLIYAATARVWLDDDSEDSAKTMAFLDKRLKQAEQWATTCQSLGRKPSPESA